MTFHFISGHSFYDRHQSKIDPEMIQTAGFDPQLVTGCQISVCRSIKGLAFPSFCTRAERRQVERVIVRATQNLTGELEGNVFYMNNRNNMSP